MRTHRFTFVPLAVVCLAAALAGCGASTLPPVRNEAERLEVARRLAAKGECNTAIDLLKTYVSVNAGSGDVDGAIYLLGTCYLSNKDWVAAGAEFERLLRDYPESDSGPSASFQLGDALLGQARPEAFDQEFTLKALEQWEKYLRANPGHWLNPRAEQRIATARRRVASKMLGNANLYLKLRLPGPARVYFERIEREYPDTGFLGDALLGQARSDVMAGKRGEAIEKLKQIETQFAGQPIANRAAHERRRLD